MEYLKKNIKWLILVIVLMIIVSGVSVYATSTYLAKQVIYKDGKTVEDALNELYSITGNITLDSLEKLTDGVAYDNEYYIIYTPNKIIWNDAQCENTNYEKIIFCHKVAGNNANFTATLPFSIDGKSFDVKLIKKIGDNGWNPVTASSSGTHFECDVNWGSPELSEYYFLVGIK